jgi:hypothetical protein
MSCKHQIQTIKYNTQMNPETKTILANIETYLATGNIPDALIPYYDQHGKWLGSPYVWFHIKRNPHLHRIQDSHLHESRRTCMDRSGTILRTSFTWRSKSRLQVTYSGIHGSLIVDSNAAIHATCLRHIGGSLITTTKKRVYLPFLRTVGGHFEAMETFELFAPRLKHVDGGAKVLGSIPPLLTTVGRSLRIFWCFAAESKHLKSVGDYLCLTKPEIVRFPELEAIGGGFLLTLLTHVVDAPKLQSIGGDFIAAAAHTLRMRSLRNVGGNLETCAAKGFYDPRIVVGGEWTTYPGDVEDWQRRDAARKILKCEDIML